MNILSHLWQGFNNVQQLLEIHPYYGWTVVAILGLIGGSFVGCISYRIPKILYYQWQSQAMQMLEVTNGNNANISKNIHILSLWKPRSHCIHCRHTLTVSELIPLLSYLATRGKCRYCKRAISPRYFVIELTGMLLLLGIYFICGPSVHFVVLALFALSIIALGWIDAEHMLLPDCIVMPLLWMGLIVNFFDMFVSHSNSFLTCIALYGLFSAIARVSQHVLGREALGQGDVKIIATFGAWMGWAPIALLLSIATTCALLYIFFRLRVKGISVRSPLPFGPFLLGSAMACLLLQTAWQLHPYSSGIFTLLPFVHIY